MVSRFYFHIFREGQRIIDRTGIELPEGTVMSRAVLKAIKERWPGTSDVDAPPQSDADKTRGHR